MIHADEVHAILDRLDAAGVAWCIDGGWGVDALVGRETRPHRDLDLVVARTELDRAAASLAPLGYAYDPSAEPGLPARLVLCAQGGRQVDLHPIVFDASGDGLQELGDGTWGRYVAAGLRGEGEIAGRRVRCITTELQLLHHRGYEPTDLDRRDIALLTRLARADPPAPER